MEAVLVVIIIFVIGYIVYPDLFKNTRILLNETGGKIPSTDDFVPYVPDENLPPDVLEVQNSVLALKFGIDAVAKGKLEANPFLCQENKKSDNTEIKNVNQCIDCNTADGKFTCTIKNFELPQSEKELGTNSWSEWIAEGVGDPKYILFYEQFPKGMEKLWATDAYQLSTKWLLVSGVLSAIPGAWEAKQALGGFKVTRKFTGEAIESVSKHITEEAEKDLGKKGAKEAGELLAKNLRKELTPNPFSAFFKNLGKAKSVLPEDDLVRKAFVDTLIESRLGTEGLEEVSSHGVIEEVLKKIKPGSSADDIANELETALARQLDDGTTVIGKTSKKMLGTEEEFLKLRYRADTSPKGLETADWLNAENNILRKEFPNEFGGTIKSLDDIPDEQIKAQVKGKVEKTAYELSQARANGNLDDALKRLASENINSEMSAIKKEIAEEMAILARLNKNQLKSLIAYQDFLSSLVKYEEKNGFVINRELLQKTLKDAATKAYPKSSILQKKALEQFDSLSSALFNKDGFLLTKPLAGARNIPEANLIDLEKGIMGNAADEFRTNAKVGKVAKNILENFVGPIEGDTVWKKIISTAGNQIPYSADVAKKFKGGITNAAIGGGIGYAVDGEEGLQSGIMLGGASGFVAGTAAGSVKWVFQHRYTVAAMLFVYSNYLESINEKYEAHGFNTLAVVTPNVLDDRDPGKEFELSEEVTDYHVAILLDKPWWNPLAKRNIERFFLASPCKADLKLTKTVCPCKVVSGEDIYEITTPGLKGKIPLTKASAIPLKQPAVVTLGDFSYTKVTKTNSDLSNAVKTCDYVSSDNVDDIYGQMIIDSGKVRPTFISTPLPILPILPIPEWYTEARLTGPCIIVEVELDEGYKKTNGKNFCYPGSEPGDDFAKAGITILSFGIDAALTGVAVGTGGILAIAAVPAMGLNGVLTDVALHYASAKWPDRG